MPPRQRRSTGVATSAGVRLIDIQLLSAFIAENFVCKECAQCPQLPGGACKAVPPAAAAADSTTARMTRGSRSGLASCFTFECATGHAQRSWTSGGKAAPGVGNGPF